jgi:hypothetical protein
MRRVIFLVGLTLFLGACALQENPTLQQGWQYADLRSLDPADAAQPTQDLVAAYARQAGEEMQVRLDFLEHTYQINYDLYLALDTKPGGRRDLPIESQTSLEWDTLVILPAAGGMQVLDTDNQTQPGTSLRLVRDPVLDTATLSLDSHRLGWETSWPPGSLPNWQIEVLLAPARERRLADRLRPFHTDSQPPPPVRALFAFWDTYPAYTPALALRRWAGAHTGPAGGSHGLLYLLRSAQNEGIPIFLLDLKDAASLSALDYAGTLGLIQEMATQGWLALPEPLPDPAYGPGSLPEWAVERIDQDNRETARRFGLPSSPFVFAPAGWLPERTDTQVVFTGLESGEANHAALEPVTPSRWRDRLLIPLLSYGAAEAPQQAGWDGPTLELRKALISSAVAANENDLLILGGELPASTWGDPRQARLTFQYLKSRPWIQFLDSHALLTHHGADSARLSPPVLTPTLDEDLMEALREAPENPIGQAAWGAFRALYAPIYPHPPELSDLRRNYLGQVWTLIEAARWAETPFTSADCSVDIDHDGAPECLLASEKYYAEFEIESGGLTLLFIRSEEGEIHQIIGPSSQLITGLSDPTAWVVSGSLIADTAVIPGAFSEPSAGYQPAIEEDEISFTTPDGTKNKIYHFGGDRLIVSYSNHTTNPGESLRLLNINDPWRRFHPGWFDQGSNEIKVVSDNPITTYPFSDTRDFFSRAEDPNQDNPPGHYLPFPATLIEISPQGNFTLQIDF